MNEQEARALMRRVQELKHKGDDMNIVKPPSAPKDIQRDRAVVALREAIDLIQIAKIETEPITKDQPSHLMNTYCMLGSATDMLFQAIEDMEHTEED